MVIKCLSVKEILFIGSWTGSCAMNKRFTQFMLLLWTKNCTHCLETKQLGIIEKKYNIFKEYRCILKNLFNKSQVCPGNNIGLRINDFMQQENPVVSICECQ